MFKHKALLLIGALGATAGCGGSETANRAGAAVSGNSASAAPAAPGMAAADPVAESGAQEGGSGASVALDAEGLRYVLASGSTRLLAFGSPVDQVVESASRIFGAKPASDGVNQECGGGPTRIVEWANGYSILAQDGAFLGWQLDEAGPTTMNGIGVGSTRAELDEAFSPSVEETSLGTEFSLGEEGEGGLLSGSGKDARITTIWAGHTCHFR